MAFEARSGSTRQYYYRSERHGDRVRKVYLGTGPDAQEQDRLVRERRQEREAELSALATQEARFARAEKALRDLLELARALLEATLLAAGYRERRGEWRRPRS